ncbi:MAG: threonine--tRNA ligase [Gammaproteobacteria bacterium]|nr:threonine--tRNA ligase [Gammaproteobacteria bacterium]
MPRITLPDGSVRSYPEPVSVFDIAHDIGPGLARAALAAEAGGILVDTSHILSDDTRLRIITERDAEGLEIIRHSCAHLLAQAVKQLFPAAQVTIGPVIEDGFYYDFAFERPFTPEDLERIEARMHELARQDLRISRSVMPRAEALGFFRAAGEEYKAQIIESIPAGESLSLYSQGDFTDLCRGPHVPSTGRIKAFKLTKVAGAYWRGDSKNEMLQRIYGTAWADKKALKEYLHRLEEAEKRDHRRIGRRLDLFHFQPEAPGMVFWHDHGWRVYREIENYVRGQLRRRGYQEVRTPQIIDRSLWEKSGHISKFGDVMFMTRSEERDFAIKPMNCPAHIQIFNQGLKSYRDLPFRMSEFGSCHRNEHSGALHGLLRVRGFTQDDAHIFCTEDQIQAEVAGLIDLVYEVYRDFGFTEVQVRLATRPVKRVGADELWDRAEAALRQALDGNKLDWTLNPGDGAFYGPKIDFSLKDSIGRVWQLGTIQLDFSMPGRLDASYVAADSSRRTPVMIHRAILGSLERFIGVLIEHHAGALPLWLAPVQVVALSLTEKQAGRADAVAETLKNQGVRAESDLRNETISLKIREHTMQRVPYLLVIGAREAEHSTVAVRTRDGVDLGAMSLDGLLERLSREIACRGRGILEG